MVGCRLRLDGARLTYFIAPKGKRGGPFTPEAERLVGVLRPHLISALAIADRFGALLSEYDLALAALEAQPQAMLLVEAGGRVIYRNRAAEAVLAASGALFVGRDGRLAGRSLALHHRLVTALRRAGQHLQRVDRLRRG